MNRGGWEGLDMSTIWLGMLLGLPLLKWSVGVVFIATNQIVVVGEVCWRWAHRTVSRAPPRHPPIRAWSWSTVGGFVLMRHRTVRCYTRQSGAPLTIFSDIWIALFTLQSRPLRASSRCPAGAPDSPVAHRTVRWIIAELRLENPKLRSLSWFTLVHRTLSGGTPDSPVRQTRAHFGFPFCSFLLKPNLFFWLVCVEPLAPVEYII
jgi:hypothetical protein